MIRAFALLLALSGPAAAEQICGSRDAFIKVMQKHGETQRMVGIAANGSLVEVWASEGGSWTGLSTTRYGKTCVTVTGFDFFQAPAPKPGVPG